jgi:3-phenylpropionate/trans-cinnamate dioxygenase ferredoxin reductase subunit
MDPIVVVGAGMAGGRAFDVLRKKSSAPVVLVGEEPLPPYNRPDLSKRCLVDDFDESRVLFHPVEHYSDDRTSFRAGTRAVRLEPDARRLTLDDGGELTYSTLLVATGGSPRRLPVPGADLPGIRYLRTLADANALRKRLGEARRVVIVGAGMVGLEVAAAARELGVEVTVVDVCDLPFAALGPEIGHGVLNSHSERGVQFHLGTTVGAFSGEGNADRVVFSDGKKIDADLVVVGIGIEPSTDWLGPAVDGAGGTLAVDSFGRTSLPDVYAAGDVTRWFHPHFGEIHTEHEAVAQNHGMRVAGNIGGAARPFTMIPYAWSDQYDHRLRTVGLASTSLSERQVSVTRADGGIATVFVREGELVGAATLDWPVFTSRLAKAMQAALPLPFTDSVVRELAAD